MSKANCRVYFSYDPILAKPKSNRTKGHMCICDSTCICVHVEDALQAVNMGCQRGWEITNISSISLDEIYLL